MPRKFAAKAPRREGEIFNLAGRGARAVRKAGSLGHKGAKTRRIGELAGRVRRERCLGHEGTETQRVGDLAGRVARAVRKSGSLGHKGTETRRIGDLAGRGMRGESRAATRVLNVGVHCATVARHTKRVLRASVPLWPTSTHVRPTTVRCATVARHTKRVLCAFVANLYARVTRHRPLRGRCASHQTSPSWLRAFVANLYARTPHHPSFTRAFVANLVDAFVAGGSLRG